MHRAATSPDKSTTGVAHHEAHTITGCGVGSRLARRLHGRSQLPSAGRSNSHCISRSHPRTRQLQAQAASYADLPWWQVFQDPKLQELIRTGAQAKLRFATGYGAHRGCARPACHYPLQPVSPSARQRQFHRRQGKYWPEQIQLSDPYRRCRVPTGSLRPSAACHGGLTGPTAGYGRCEANSHIDAGE